MVLWKYSLNSSVIDTFLNIESNIKLDTETATHLHTTKNSQYNDNQDHT